MAEVGVLVNVSLIEIDQEVAVALGAGQQVLEAADESLSLLRIRAAEQFFGFLPRQREAVHGRPDGLATDAEAEALAHERHQVLEGEAGRRIGAIYGRCGRRTLGRGTTSPRLAAVRAQGGTAAGAAISQGRGALSVIGMQPTHHGLRMAPGARRHLGGTASLSHVVEGECALAGVRMRRVQRQPPQVIRCLTLASTISP
jgi:hypothetical protein